MHIIFFANVLFLVWDKCCENKSAVLHLSEKFLKFKITNIPENDTNVYDYESTKILETLNGCDCRVVVFTSVYVIILTPVGREVYYIQQYVK